MLALVAVLIVIPIAWVLFGGHGSATAFTVNAMTPALDLQYFSTFSWLLFAVAGAEVAAPYVRQTEDPQRNFPRAILASTILIGAAYVLCTVAVSLLMPLDSLTKATGLYDIWIHLAALIGLPATLFARACMTFLIVGFVAAYIIWMESPIRVMFADVPKGTFPATLTRRDAGGTHHQALWVQALVVSMLILIPLVSIFTGTTGSERFISLLNDMASLSLVIPYMFVALAYIRARRRGMDAPFKMVRSTPVAIAIGVLVLVVSAYRLPRRRGLRVASTTDRLDLRGGRLRWPDRADLPRPCATRRLDASARAQRGRTGVNAGCWRPLAKHNVIAGP